MKTYHASTRARHVSRPTFRLIRCCLFCGSSRVTFVAGDDDGPYAAVKCNHCEAEGSHVRARVWESTTVTDEMKQEAADAWNSIWNHVVGPPAEVLVDSEGNEIAPAARKRRRRPARPAMVLAPTQPAEHQVAIVAPPKGTNGHNGHHQNGSAL